MRFETQPCSEYIFDCNLSHLFVVFIFCLLENLEAVRERACLIGMCTYFGHSLLEVMQN